jgi:hypothetical protein
VLQIYRWVVFCFWEVVEVGERVFIVDGQMFVLVESRWWRFIDRWLL